RIPASCNGLVGLKPTRGRISQGPDLGESVDGLATDLVVSKTVRDTAAALDVASGPVMGDPYWEPPKPKSYLDAMKTPPKKLRFALARPGDAHSRLYCLVDGQSRRRYRHDRHAVGADTNRRQIRRHDVGALS